MEILSIISLLLGAVGTTLGIMNFVLDRLERRVRIKIIPKAAILIKGGYITTDSSKNWNDEKKINLDTAIPAIEVINLSAFSVSVDEIGYFNNDGKGRAAFILPLTSPKGQIPYRIQPRESVTFYSHNDNVGGSKSYNWKYAFAGTSCGLRFKEKLKSFPFQK